jgi:hypothetical protein
MNVGPEATAKRVLISYLGTTDPGRLRQAEADLSFPVHGELEPGLTLGHVS